MDHAGAHEEGPSRPRRERPRDARPERACAQLLLAHTGSFGVRVQHVDRFAERRTLSRVELPGGTVAVKHRGAPAHDGQVKVEHDDASPSPAGSASHCAR